MNQEEQIRQVALNLDNYSDTKCDVVSFVDEIKLADANLYWHKYPNEKPTSIPMLFTYIVWDGDEFHTASWNGYHFYDRFDPLVEDKYVKFWMLLPEPPDLD